MSPTPHLELKELSKNTGKLAQTSHWDQLNALQSLQAGRKSFSPEVNALLAKLDVSSSRNILGCGTEELLIRSPNAFSVKGEVKFR